MVLGVAADRDSTTVLGDNVSFGDGRGGVVGPFGVDVRLEAAKYAFDVGFFKDEDVVYTLEAGDEFGAFVLRHNGAVRALIGTGRGVAVDRND